jgi:hypothetical protein
MVDLERYPDTEIVIRNNPSFMERLLLVLNAFLNNDWILLGKLGL